MVLSDFVLQQCRIIADRRTVNHQSSGKCRPLTDDFWYKGLIGEAVFASEFGLEPDYSDRVGGDSGHDFKTIIGTVDVKTVSKTAPPFLLVEKGKKHSKMADIIVLAVFDDANTQLVGWVYSVEILKCPTRTFGSHGIEDYYKPIDELRTMNDLKTEMCLALQKKAGNFKKRFVYA